MTPVASSVTFPASEAITPFNTAVPVRVTDVLPSYSLLLAERPVMERLTAEMLAANPDGCVKV